MGAGCLVSASRPPFVLTVDAPCSAEQVGDTSIRINHADSLWVSVELCEFGPDGSAPAALWWQVFDYVNGAPVTSTPVEIDTIERDGFWVAEFVATGFVNYGSARARRTVLQMVVVYESGYQLTIPYEVWVVRRFGMQIPGLPDDQVDHDGELYMDFLSAMIEGVTQ